MINEHLKIYQQFCEKHEEDLPIFFQPYWLDAMVGRSGWDFVLIEEGGEVRAVMPFAKAKKMGMNIINNPPITPYTGIYFNYPHNIIKQERRLSFENRIAKEVIAQIPSHLYFHLCFYPEFKNWLPFHWASYKQSTKYTYVIPSDKTEEAAFADIKSKTKNIIRKATQNLELKATEDLDIYNEQIEKTFRRQNQELPYDQGILEKLNVALAAKNQRKIYYAQDQEGSVHASIYIANDAKKSYCIGIGSDPSYRASGAISALLWLAIKEALAAGRAFDFEGSMMANIEPIFRSFGADQVPYFRIYNSPNRLTHALFSFLGKW